MAVTRFNPSTELFRPIFDDFFTLAGGQPQNSGLLRAPNADVVEMENEIRVALEMPGIRPEDIEVDLENNVLTVSGEKREDRQEGDERSTWHLTERRYGRFSRSFVLPRDVEQDSIQATFDNGVLHVSIPKSERARRRRIEVRGTDSGAREVGSGKEKAEQR